MTTKGVLQRDLESVLSVRPARGHVASYIHLCHRMAVAYIMQRVRTGRLRAESFGMTVDDLAMDVIADLFERDEHGVFPQLVTYYTALDWRSGDEQRLIAATRRLVMSKASEGLFYRFQEHDPGLGRIIRNLKRALDGHALLVSYRSASCLWIGVQCTESSDPGSLPLMPPEFLEIHLAGRLGSVRSTTDVLDAVGAILNAQSLYRTSLPLTMVAQAIRAASVHLEASVGDVRPFAAVQQGRDIESLIRRCIRQTQSDLEQTYVGRRKVTPDAYPLYFIAVRNRLLEEVEDGSVSISNYEALRAVISPLSKDVYMRDHRAIFEYMMRMTKRSLIQQLVAENWISAPEGTGKDVSIQERTRTHAQA
jgi:hypothetical protein